MQDIIGEEYVRQFGELKIKQQQEWMDGNKERLDALKERRDALKEEKRQLMLLWKRVNFFMTKEEFKLIRSCLHPDSHM